MGSASRRGWAALVLLTLAATFVGPMHGVASAVVGPIRVSASQSEAEATPEPATVPEEPPGAAGDAGTRSHGCGEGGDAAALVACTEAAAACAEEPPQDPSVCAEPLVQAVTETAGDLPPGDEEPPPCEGTEPQEQLDCAVQQVREQCPDGADCSPLDLVQACLDGTEQCSADDVLADGAAAVCGAVAEQPGEEDPEEESTCEEDLATCDTAPQGEECQRGLGYVQERVHETACEPGAPACAVVDQVEELLDCEEPADCFQAVWDPAALTICEVVDAEDTEGCATTLDTCDDPSTVESGCDEAAAYLSGRVQDTPCDATDAICAVERSVEDCSTAQDETCGDALFGVLAAVCAAGASDDCLPEPLPSLRDCIDWDGAPVPDPVCVRDAVVDAICAFQTDDCVLTHPAVLALMAVPDNCAAGVGEDGCQDGLQSVALAALCADKALGVCFPEWQDEAAACQGPDDRSCHALALLHQLCGSSPCAEPLQSLEPCVRGAEAQECRQADEEEGEDLQPYLQRWIGQQCATSAVSSTACPKRVDVRAQRASVTPPSAEPVPPQQPVMEPNVAALRNGSSTFPFFNLTEALSAMRAEERQAQHLALAGHLHMYAGTYKDVGLTFGPDEPEGLDLRIMTQGTDPPVIAPATGPGLTLLRGHSLRIEGPITVLGQPAVLGPEDDTSFVVPERAYVGDRLPVSLSYDNDDADDVELPEPVVIRLVLVEGPADALVVEVAGQADPVGWGSDRSIDLAGGDGLFQASAGVHVTSETAARWRLAARVVGSRTGVVYAEDVAELTVVTPQAPPTPPPSVPRTPENDHEAPPAVRISGEDRSATAAAVSRASFPDGAEQVFVATGQSFADALAAGPAASRSASPVVLVERDRIPDSTHAEIERLHPRGVNLMGGTAAIGPEVEAQIAAMGVEVTRLRGGDRYATAAAVSAAHFSPGVAVAYVAGGEGFADALSGGAAAAALGGPVLLVHRDDLPSSTAEELRRLRPGRVVVLGGRQAVSDDVAESLREFTGEVRRVSGPTRYATSAAVSRDVFGVTGGTVYVATGETFPDALAGVPAAGADRAPLMLVEPDRLPPEIAAELDRLQPKRIVILGGERSVTQRLERELRSYQVP